MAEEYSRKLNITLQYPHSDEYEYLTKIAVIDLDLEAQKDIASGDGFIISAPKNSNKKDMKNIDGIYSSRFGQRLGDVNPYADRYRCVCIYGSSLYCRLDESAGRTHILRHSHHSFWL